MGGALVALVVRVLEMRWLLVGEGGEGGTYGEVVVPVCFHFGGLDFEWELDCRLGGF